jgi:indolepyruvate ferredoxin oxidoreductase beta subunit
MNLERKFMLAGIGGQGVIFATKVLAHAALAQGVKVMVSENHGMSQRGGSVLSHIKFGGSEAPLVRRATADGLIAFDRNEALRNLTFVRTGGSVYVNSLDGLDPAVMPRLNELKISVWAFNATACALELGVPGVLNLIVLGFAAAHTDLGLSVSDLQAAVRALGPARSIEVNLKALDVGAAQAQLVLSAAQA